MIRMAPQPASAPRPLIPYRRTPELKPLSARSARWVRSAQHLLNAVAPHHQHRD